MKQPRTPLLLVLVSSLVLAQPLLASDPVPNPAQEPVSSTEFDGRKFFDLAACAVSIMAISTGVGATIAALTCGKAALTWWSE